MPFIRFVIPLAGAMLLSACTGFAPRSDFAAQAEHQATEVPHWDTSVSGEPVGMLTDLIGSPELEALVREAFANNPGLQQTLLTLEKSRIDLQITDSNRLPEASAGLAVDRTEDAATRYTGSVSVSWQVDLWRKLADGVRAAERDVAQQQALLDGARDSLAAEVMLGWLGLIGEQRALAVETARLATLELNTALILQRYRSGLGTLEDLDSARSAEHSSRATVVAGGEAVARRQRSLLILLGRLSDEPVALPAAYPDVVVPLANLPEQTLARRPDLRAAYHAIVAADLRTRAAYKDLLPSLSLSAMLEDIASSPAQALLTDPAWSLLGQLTAPLFNGGRLKAEAQRQELNTAQAYQTYRETLLAAIGEIRDGLGREKALAEQQQHLELALQHQRSNLARYQQKYRSGGATILELLSVQRETYDLEAQLDALIHDRLANRVTLALALGLGASE